MLPETVITKTSYVNVGEQQSVYQQIVNSEVILPTKAVVRSVDLTGKVIPSSITVLIGTAGNDTFTETYSYPVIGKHFMYTELGGVPKLYFDGTLYNSSYVTVMYAARGDFIDSDTINEITNDLSVMSTNFFTPVILDTPLNTVLYKIIIGNTVMTDTKTIDLTPLLTGIVSQHTPVIIAFPTNVTDNPINNLQIGVTVSGNNVTFSASASDQCTINYIIYVYMTV